MALLSWRPSHCHALLTLPHARGTARQQHAAPRRPLGSPGRPAAPAPATRPAASSSGSLELARTGGLDMGAVERRLADAASISAPFGGQPSLLHALAAQPLAVVQQLLPRALLAGADVAACDSSREQPLHVAADNPDASAAEAAVRLLLAAGADAGALTRHGLTACHIAASSLSPRPGVILALAAGGCPVDLPAPAGLKTPLACALLNYHAGAMQAAVAALLQAGASPHAAAAAGEGQPLHLAAARARRGLAAASVITMLCRAGADPNARSPEGLAPLHIALAEPMSGPAIDAALALLGEGADPNLPAGDGSGLAPLHAVAGFADGEAAVRLVRALVAAGADAGLPAADGSQPLHRAAANMQIYLAIHVPLPALPAGAPGRSSHGSGAPVRHKRSAGADVVAALVAAGASPAARARDGMQPLHVCAASARPDNYRGGLAATSLVAVLVAAGAPLDAADSRQQSPLHHAMANRSAAGPAVVRALIEAGASARPLLNRL